MVAVVHDEDLVVQAAGLTKVFKDFWGRPKARAVNGIDLAIRPGQIFGLLGPNGSGKSTTVKLILGLLHPSRGTLRVLNESPRNVAIKRRIGYLPEESYLYRYLTARETLDFFGALFGLPAEERRRRTDQLLDMVGLTNSRDRQVGEFSKGMARRIGLAQALVNDPTLVILDEPTAGLDPIGCREVKDLIRLLASRGKTVILCTHLLADVQDVCDEVAVLYGGNVRSQGRLADILAVEDQMRITTPKLSDEHVQEVLALLERSVKREDIAVDRPTMSLEEFFLDVVRKARAASIETAGAQAGGTIAEYLRGTPATDEGLSERIRVALETKTPDAESEPMDTPAPDREAEHRELSARLAHLTADEPAVPAEPAAEPTARRSQGEPVEDARQASNRLEELLRKKSENE